jgi:integrase
MSSATRLDVQPDGPDRKVAAGRKRPESPFLPAKKKAPTAASTVPPLVAQRVSETLDALAAEPGQLALNAETFPLFISGSKHALTDEQVAGARNLMEAILKHDISGYAANSAKSIRADWRHWMAFCAQRDRQFMPVLFDDLVEFLDALVAAGYRRATLDHILFTIRLFSKIYDCPSPTELIQFTWYWRDLCSRDDFRQRQHQATGLGKKKIRELATAAIAAPMPSASPSGDDTPAKPMPAHKRAIELRDALFVAMAYDLMARGSEMVALRWDDIEFESPDHGHGAIIEIRRSKTDQTGRGDQKYLQAPTVQLLHAWREMRFATVDLLWDEGQAQLLANPFIFHRIPRYKVLAPMPARQSAADRWDGGLNVREADRIIKRAAGAEFSSHSTRVGATQDLTRSNASLAYIMQEGRWKSPAMPARYAAKELAAKAGAQRRRLLEALDDPSDPDA